MRLYFELQPTRFREKLEAQLDAIRGMIERVHIPDAPMGYPKASTLALASIAIQRGYRATVHLRTQDYNYVGFLNQIYGSYLIGVDRLLFLRGDPPFRGSAISDVTSEEALRLLRQDERLRGIEGGLIVSLRYPREDVLRRLSLGPDFILVTHKDVERLREIRGSYGGEVIGYLIVRTGKNARYVDGLPQAEDVCGLELIKRCIERYRDLLDGLLVSCPMDIAACASEIGRIKP